MILWTEYCVWLSESRKLCTQIYIEVEWKYSSIGSKLASDKEIALDVKRLWVKKIHIYQSRKQRSQVQSPVRWWSRQTSSLPTSSSPGENGRRWNILTHVAQKWLDKGVQWAVLTQWGAPSQEPWTLPERSILCKWWNSIPLKLSGSFWEVCYQQRALALQFVVKLRKDAIIRKWASRLYLESLHLYPPFSSGLELTYLLPRGVHKADLGLRDSKSEGEMLLWAHFPPFATLNGREVLFISHLYLPQVPSLS